MPEDLDDCGGHEHGDIPGYHYHTQPSEPYVIGCFHGEVECDTTESYSGCEKYTKYSNLMATVSSESSLTCDSILAKAMTGSMVEHGWSVDSDKIPTTAHCGLDYCDPKAAYSYDSSGTDTGLSSSMTCSSYDDSLLIIQSNGIPNHAVAVFPLSENTIGSSARNRDQSKTISEASNYWYIPVHPTPSATDRTPVTQDISVLPSVVGFALNGCPFFGPTITQSDGITEVFALDEVNNAEEYTVLDICYGTITNGVYGYIGTPWCLIDEDSAATTDEWFHAHGLSHKLNTDTPTKTPTLTPTKTPTLAPTKMPTLVPTLTPTRVPTMAPTTNCADGHSEQMGYALDGYPIYGPYSCGGYMPEDLDDCGGHEHGDIPGYHYHTQPSEPYVIGCFHGEVECDTTESYSGCEKYTKYSNLMATVSSESSLTCDSILAKAMTGSMVEHGWSVDSDKIPTTAHCGLDYCDPKAAYSYDSSGTDTGLSSSMTCSSYDDSLLIIQSNGIPNHAVAVFPLSENTIGSSARNRDQSKTISEASNYWYIPVHPTPSATDRTPVTQDISVLPSVVGFALNGCPFFGPTITQSDGITEVFALDEVNNAEEYTVLDICYGTITNGVYGYIGTPWCLIDEDSAATTDEWFHAHDLSHKLNTDAPTKAPTKTPTLAPTKTPTVAPTRTPTLEPTLSPTKVPTNVPTRTPTLAPTSICGDGHSDQIGYIMDGFPIYGPYSCGGTVPSKSPPAPPRPYQTSIWCVQGAARYILS